MALPETGRLPLLHADRHHNRSDIEVRVVRSLDDLQKVNILRAITYMAEQACPYDEEFDGNDLTATHLIGFVDGTENPVGRAAIAATVSASASGKSWARVRPSVDAIMAPCSSGIECRIPVMTRSRSSCLLMGWLASNLP